MNPSIFPYLVDTVTVETTGKNAHNANSAMSNIVPNSSARSSSVTFHNFMFFLRKKVLIEGSLNKATLRIINVKLQ